MEHRSPLPISPPERNITSLRDYEEGDVVVVAEVADRESEVLDYLAEAGISPGTELSITEIAPFGMISVAILGESGDDMVSLPEEVATTVRVCDADSDYADNGSVAAS